VSVIEYTYHVYFVILAFSFLRVETAEKIFIYPAQFTSATKFVVINRITDEITIGSELIAINYQALATNLLDFPSHPFTI
jgi:hypothetical protein